MDRHLDIDELVSLNNVLGDDAWVMVRHVAACPKCLEDFRATAALQQSLHAKRDLNEATFDMVMARLNAVRNDRGGLVNAVIPALLFVAATVTALIVVSTVTSVAPLARLFAAGIVGLVVARSARNHEAATV